VQEHCSNARGPPGADAFPRAARLICHERPGKAMVFFQRRKRRAHLARDSLQNDVWILGLWAAPQSADIIIASTAAG